MDGLGQQLLTGTFLTLDYQGEIGTCKFFGPLENCYDMILYSNKVTEPVDHEVLLTVRVLQRVKSKFQASFIR